MRATASAITVLAAWVALVCSAAAAHELDPALVPLAEKETAPLLETLRALTAFDSGTGQAPGLEGVAAYIENFARAIGGDVQRVAPANDVAGTNLLITFKGTGKRSVLLIAHMDTVYTAGTAAARPFRINGNRAIAPGIADDKSGIAVFLHAMNLLKARGFSDYERVTMLFTTDEERGSAGSRDLIRSQARAHDAVLSGEPTGPDEGVVLGTSGVGQLNVRVQAGPDARAIEELADVILRSVDAQREVPETRMNWTVMRAEDPAGLGRLSNTAYDFATLTFRVKGRASHAGVSPELGVNAVVETADIVRRVSAASARMPQVRLHWRIAGGGVVSNIIPERAQAVAELAVPKNQDMRPVVERLAEAGAGGLLSGVEITAESAEGLPEKSAAQGQAFASADQRVPDAQAYASLVRQARARIGQQKFSASAITVQDGLFFPPFNATAQGRELAQLAREINARLGGTLTLYPRTYGGTDAAWAGQSGQPVVESMGLPGGNYHSSQEEFILIDRIPRRLALVAEMIRAIAQRP
ncbi:M20/M25/M40 family metallo-hydrolase [Caenimonas koreensis]|uniref:M20/M25/M40 family metallo-hydrolase n=1 Tax=Caenimonas koreensis TaxID=367474 RepID=UPI003783D0F9